MRNEIALVARIAISAGVQDLLASSFQSLYCLYSMKKFSNDLLPTFYWYVYQVVTTWYCFSTVYQKVRIYYCITMWK